MNGGFTNPDIHLFCSAAAQTKAAMDMNHKLGGRNHVFWGGGEGYQSMLDIDMKQEWLLSTTWALPISKRWATSFNS